MIKHSREPKRARPSHWQRGQSMVEYSMLNWLLIVGLVLASTVRVLPGPANQYGTILKRNVIEMFLEAYQTYYDSFYFLLNMPFP